MESRDQDQKKNETNVNEDPEAWLEYTETEVTVEGEPALMQDNRPTPQFYEDKAKEGENSPNKEPPKEPGMSEALHETVDDSRHDW